MTPRFPQLRSVASTALLALALAVPVAAQGVHVALLDAQTTVAPDSTFTLDLQVTAAGTAFNAFDAVVSFDPAALTFLPTSPTSLQQGVLMSGACGNTFHLFKASGDSLVVNLSLLCANQSLTGPGQLYRLRFRALGPPQITWVRLRRVQFYDAGVNVGPAYLADAEVGIGIDLDAPRPGVPTAGLEVAASPNPFRGTTALTLRAAAAGTQHVVVHDLAGRAVRHLDSGARGAGERRLWWDGNDDAGRPLSAGVYLVTLLTATGQAHARVALLR